MTILIVAHGTNKEVEIASDFANGMNGCCAYLCPPKDAFLVNLDVVREHFNVIDALVVIQCEASTQANGSEESELQRLERLAIDEAAEAGKLVSIVGNWQTLNARHLTRCGARVNLVGLYQTKENAPDNVTERFRVARFFTIDDMRLGGQEIVRRLHELQKQAAA